MKARLFGFTLLAAAIPVLQGCFPLAVGGMGAAALMATDRRTTGIYIEDESIEWKSVGKLRDAFPGSHVTATSFNRRVLLTGEVASEEMKKQVEDAVRSVPNVKEITNEVQIAGASSLASRGNDALVTSNVRARMLRAQGFTPTHVKVVTEASVVYLMGLVTQAEGDAAAEVARSTSGVNRVVKVFEYIK